MLSIDNGHVAKAKRAALKRLHRLRRERITHNQARVLCHRVGHRAIPRRGADFHEETSGVAIGENPDEGPCCVDNASQTRPRLGG